MIKKIIKSKTKSTIGAAIVVGAASLISRFIGLARDKIFAHQFGASNILDAYYAAFRVPDLVYNMLVVGALSAGFIPVFKELLEKDEKKAWKVTNGILNILAISLLIV
ncbi:MAG: murein biosynthesis integral membrane protein MurJ, partial [Parcubacteria group bacterium QH_9_35_7]